MNTILAERPVSQHAPFSAEQLAEFAFRSALVKAWRSTKEHSAAAHAAYAMIRGKSMAKTFSPITNANKLACQGGNPYRAAEEAISTAKSGQAHAWGWAQEILKAAGMEPDRYHRFDLAKHPSLAGWMKQAAEENKGWAL